MDTANAKKYRYFLYSKQQHKLREQVDYKINKVFTPGKVLVNGRWQIFTEISLKPTNAFADTRVIAEGNLEDMKYQNHTSVWGAM